MRDIQKNFQIFLKGKGGDNKVGRFIQRFSISFGIVVMVMAFAATSKSYAQPEEISKKIQQLMGSVKIKDAEKARGMKVQRPFYATGKGGYLIHFSAPPSHYFPVKNVVAGNPKETARNFLKEYREILGATSPSVDFRPSKSKTKENRHYESFEQTYEGIPVYDGRVLVQLNISGGVEYMLSDMALDTQELDNWTLSTKPVVTEHEAVKLALDYFSEKHAEVKIETTTPELYIYDPDIIGNTGGLRLVWVMEVSSPEDLSFDKEVLIDAHSGEIVLEVALVYPALSRTIYDQNNTKTVPVDPSRSDTVNPPGPNPTGIAEVDNAYDFLGDSYNFYWNEHKRDSIDKKGGTLEAVVRHCPSWTQQCPWSNASGGHLLMYFGDGYASADDVVGHEYTHGITALESKLAYQNQSGAINESFSDIWGEIIDLINGKGSDTLLDRWLLGEDLPEKENRDMKDPTRKGDPDRMSAFVGCGGQTPNCDPWGNDCCYVHTNSGIGNKLAYLLTDGDSFNGQTIEGMGFLAVADLFYEVQTGTLYNTPGATYYDLYHALRQAAINLDWATLEINNLMMACRAVEISLPTTGIIKINDGAIYTNSTSVTLDLSAIVSERSASEMEMCISNIDNSDLCQIFNRWENSAPSRPWTLPSGDGIKTVYAWFRNSAGKLSAYSDSIVLDTTPPTGSIMINDGAECTRSTSVTLTLSANDPGSGVSRMCIRNSLSTFPFCFLNDPGEPYSSCGGSSDLWDPDDDTGAGATVLAKPEACEQIHCPHTVSGRYSGSDRYDWFKVYLTANNSYNFNTIGGTGDDWGELYSDQNGSNLAAQDDDSGGNEQFSLNYTPASTGWYYLKVGCYTGTCSYTLRYRQTSATPPSPAEPCGHSKFWTLPSGDGAKTVYVKFMDGMGNVSTYSDSIILNTTPLTVIKPNKSEIIPSGSVYSIQWLKSSCPVKFDVLFSANANTFTPTWKFIAKGVTGTNFNWSVPMPIENKPNCKIKVIGYDAMGNPVGEDVSDNTFKIEVVKVISPNGGEIWKVSSNHAITWTTNGTKNPVANVKLFYTINGGGTWNFIKTVIGNPGSADWRVIAAASAKCKVKVELKNALGNTIGTDVSDYFFSIGP